MGSLPPAPPVQGQLLALNPQSLAIVELMNDSQIPGFTPHAFAYDPPTHRFFVANATDGYVGIFNATTLYEVTTLHAPCPTTCPDGEVADTLNGQVWQTDGSPSIYRIWARNTTYLPKTLQDPHGGFDPGAMVAVPLGTPSAPNRSIVWIATYQGPYFEGFNSTNGAWWANTSASGGVTALAYVPAPGAFLAGESIGNPGNLEVQSFLAASGVPLHDYNFSIPSPSSGIARITGIQPAATGTGLVAVGGYGPGVDRELNVSNRSGGAEDTLASVRSYRVAPSVQEASLWDPANGSFLVADEDPNQLCSYNATTGALLWNVTLGSAPITDLALDPAKGWVFLGLPGNIVATFDASNGSSVGAIHVNSTAPMGVAFDPTVGRLFLLNGSGNGTVTEWNDSTWPPRLVGPFAPRRSSTAENTTAIFCDPSWNGIWYVGNAGPGTTVARAFNFSSMKSGAGGILPFSDPLDAGTVNATGWLFLPDPLEAAVQAFSPSGSSSLRLATNGFGVTSVAVDTAERVAYLGSNVSAEVGVLDLATGQILGSLNAGGSVTAAGLALGSGPGILLDPPASTGDQVYFAELAAPTPPSNVTVVSSNASLLVRWSPPSQPLPVPLLGFTVEAQAGLGEPGQDSGNSTNMTLDAATVTGLSDGTNYTVWVASINAAGTGSESPGVVGIPLGVPYPPSAPVETRSSTATISLSWSPPKLTGGASVTGYFVR
ncbi:MAG: fibronectin type III domain-containing protein, partial [Thermoplasmata archaeon]|nr:fibronectin type III domain-containing protein [Thermoplasmata archaeon]